MGRIMLATSASTDEEYGGTFATQASEVAYDNTSSGLTADDVQGAIDEVDGYCDTLLARIQRKQFLNKNSVSFNNIPNTCTGILLTRPFDSTSQWWILASFNVYNGAACIDYNPYNPQSRTTEIPTSASYNNGTLTITYAGTTAAFVDIFYGA